MISHFEHVFGYVQQLTSTSLGNAVVAYVLPGLISYILIVFVKKYIRDKRLRKVVKEKVESLRKAKLVLSKKLAEQNQGEIDRREKILAATFEQLRTALQDGIYTAKEVLHAYQAKALEVDEKTNCINEIIEEAEGWADELDSSPSKRPLHGIPISIKDNISVKGHDCTLGLVKYLNKPEQVDAKYVKFLKEAGAVPFVKTNVPQTLLSFHCGNPVFGLTVNPLDPLRTTGGSSGGEGALIRLGGSIVGMGSDIGGSLRIPSHMCGICCLKPTCNRVSGVNVRKSMEGVVGVIGVSGPMSREVDGVVQIMRVLLSENMFLDDPDLVPIPFQEDLYSSEKPLKIGYYVDDGIITPTPGCQRAVREAKAMLERRGHELIPFTIPDPWKAYNLTFRLLCADGQQYLRQRWENDLVEPSMRISHCVAQLPGWIRKLMSVFIGIFSPRTALLASQTGSTAFEVWKDMYEREKYLQTFYALWKEKELDAMLAPGFSLPAPPHAAPSKISPAAFTTMIYNLLNLPAGTVPVTEESEQDQAQLKYYRTDDVYFKLVKKATLGATGMPIGVQIVSLPWKDELVLRLMKEIENEMKGKLY